MILFIISFTTKLYSQSVPSYVPTNGLVGWWGFNGNAQDGSGNGNHGTVNGATLTTDRFGNQNSSYFYNGINNYIQLPFSLNTNTYSISCFFNAQTLSWMNAIIGNDDEQCGGRLLAIRNNNPQIHNCVPSVCCNDISASSTINSGNWYHLAISVNNGLVTFFINGTANGPYNGVSFYGNNWRVGVKGTNITQIPFHGKIDDIGFWNRALTQQEITNLYNAQNPQPCTTSITNNINISGCGFAVLSSGDTVNQSGTYIDTLLNSLGCDSILNQLVTIQNPSTCNPVPSYVPTNGLVGWWGFNGNSLDGSGNGNHGTVNGATLTTDRFGNQDRAYRFSLAGNRITTQSLGISGNNQRSVSVWVSQELSNTGNNQWVFFSYGGGGSGNGFGINIFPSNIPNQANRIGVDIQGSYVVYNPMISQNIWHHVVCTYSPVWGNYVTNCKIYLDGNLLTSVAGIYFPNTFLNTLISSPVLFGNPNSNLEEQFRGKLDDIGIWNRALTQQEITNLYNSQLPTQTSLCLPTITTSTPSSIGIDSVVIGGDILNDGGSSIVLRGVCYSTTPNPNMGNPRTEEGSGIGSFTSTLRNLSPSTTYYARSYAKNSQGVVVYGNEVSFSTGTPIPGVRCPGTPSVTDIDGNLYHTVQIGTQCWTQSNLKVSKYRNGDNILTGLSNTAWENTTGGSYAIYNNDPVNDGLYGKLYNHYAVLDTRGLCPTGWHVPSDGEWMQLVKYLDPNADTICSGCVQSGIAGGALKSAATQPTLGGWNSPNMGASNSSGFTAVPGGQRHLGFFFHLGNYGDWWTSSHSQTFAWNRYMGYNLGVGRDYKNRTDGFSIRCLKD